MRSTQDVVYAVTGQKLFFDCPEGRPTSVTSCSVFRWDAGDDNTAEVAAGAGSVETGPNTTLDGAAGRSQSDPRNLPVAATTGAIIGRTYLLTGSAGLREWFEVAAFVSADTLTAKHPLHNDYATGALVQSTRIEATIDSTWVADSSNLIAVDETRGTPGYRVRWVYVVSGTTHVADTYFNLVRYAGSHGVLPQDLESMSPGWLDRLPTDHQADQGRRLIDDALRVVKIDLHQIDLSQSSIAESEITDELVRLKALEIGEWSKFLAGSGSAEILAATKARYTERIDSLIRIVSRVPVRDTTGAATPVIAVGLTRR